MSDAVSTHARSLPRAPARPELVRRGAVWVALALTVGVALVVAPAVVGTGQWPVLLRQAAPLGLLAIGQTVLVIGRGFDLSVGGVVGLVNVVAAGTFAQRNGTAAVVLLCLGVGLVVGTINGATVAFGRVSPLVATLGTSFLLTGAMLVYTGGAPTGSIPEGIRALSRAQLGGLALAVWIWLGVALIVGLTLARAWPGRYVHAVGSNPDAARFAGVRTAWVRFGSHVLCSLTAALGGLLLAGFVGIGTLGAGQTLMLDSLAATVVGGTVLVGGRGGVSGTVGGAILLTVLAALLTGAGAGAAGSLLTQGLVLVGAAALFRQQHPVG